MSGWEWTVGTRYLRSAHRRGFVSFVAVISALGLMLGVAVLVVQYNGKQTRLRQDETDEDEKLDLDRQHWARTTEEEPNERTREKDQTGTLHLIECRGE